MNTKKREIEYRLDIIWNKIGIDKPSNHDKILDYVYDDVCETADAEIWNSDDVSIGFRRWIESKSK